MHRNNLVGDEFGTKTQNQSCEKDNNRRKSSTFIKNILIRDCRRRL